MAIFKIGFTAAFGLLFVFAKGQEDYRKIFSSDYDKAIRFLKAEEKWMNEMVLTYGLKPKEVKAIVFPELIRYGSIQDRLETFALESLYIQYGKKYSNFSIGQFQIKPSFAESIEIDFLKQFGHTKITATDTAHSVTAREIRLRKLKDKKAMLNYVCLFFKIMEAKYPRWSTTEEKVKFFASAYNSDYRKSETEIRKFTTRKFFHTGLMANQKYCYADIAWYYHQNE